MRISRVVRSLVLPFALILVTAPAVFSGAAPGKVLRFRPKEGDTAAYDYKVSGRARLTEEGGQKAQFEVSAQTTCTVEFLGGTASGDMGVRATVEPHTVTGKTDGEDEVTEAPEVSARYTVNPLGRIKSVSWLTGDPMLAPEHAQITTTPDDVFLLSGAAILPEKPVKKGDKWSGTVKVPGAVMGEDETIKYESQLLGEEVFRGIPCAKIKTKATTSVSASEDAPDGSGTMAISAKVTGVATWLFDPERGVIVSVQETANVSMTVKVEMVGDLLLKGTLSAVENSRSTLTEYNGVPLG